MKKAPRWAQLGRRGGVAGNSLLDRSALDSAFRGEKCPWARRGTLDSPAPAARGRERGARRGRHLCGAGSEPGAAPQPGPRGRCGRARPASARGRPPVGRGRLPSPRPGLRDAWAPPGKHRAPAPPGEAGVSVWGPDAAPEAQAAPSDFLPVLAGAAGRGSAPSGRRGAVRCGADAAARGPPPARRGLLPLIPDFLQPDLRVLSSLTCLSVCDPPR